MVLEQVSFKGLAIGVLGVVFGLLLPAIIQITIGKVFDGDVSLDFSSLPQSRGVEFRSAQAMKDWQIRMVGASKIIFPIALIIYLIILLFSQITYRYGILISLIIGTSTISWTDLLAIEDPQEWSLQITSMYSIDDERSAILPGYFPSIRDRLVTYITSLIFIGVVIILILEYQGLLDYILNNDNPPYDVTEIAQIVSGIGSVLLSIILVMLYDKQASISDTQSMIQEEQVGLMRREREPRLSGPYNFRFWGSKIWVQSKIDSSTRINTRTDEQEPNPNSIQFFQTNAGEGLAQDFKLEVSLTVNEGPHTGRVAVCAVQRMDRFPFRKFGESDLQGGEKDVDFITETISLKFTEPNNNISFDTYEFEEGINTLVKQGTTNISLTFTLTWKDEFGEKDTDQVYFIDSDISSDMSLTDFVQ